MGELGPCTEWEGFRDYKGYGITHKGSRKVRKAHRVAWEEANGPIPDGLHVRHRCDNRACVNPDHLELGTHQQNMADMMARERNAYGERSGKAKFTDDIIALIRDADKSVTNEELSRITGVSSSYISRLRRRERRIK